jgi:hypothetical protein
MHTYQEQQVEGWLVQEEAVKESEEGLHHWVVERNREMLDSCQMQHLLRIDCIQDSVKLKN